MPFAKNLLTNMLISPDKHVDFSYQTIFERSQDDITNYANDIISLGLFYFSYKDAVQEGDGDRVKTCWKYLLPIFKASDKRNYSSEVLRMLYTVTTTLYLPVKHSNCSTLVS